MEEDVLPVSALGGKLLEGAVAADPMLGAELRPELHPDYGRKKTRFRHASRPPPPPPANTHSDSRIARSEA